VSSLTIQELALDFMHICSRSTLDNQGNSEKYLEAEKIVTQINSKSEKLKTENPVGSDYPKLSSQINTSKNPDYPTLFNACRILSLALLREHVFRV
jgi:prophage maintenance system killer protein